MDKIASPQDLASELRALLASCQDGASREKLASELRGLADRVAGFKVTPVDWTQKGDTWLSKAKYADGQLHEWVIVKKGKKFTIKVEISQQGIPEGTYTRKKDVDTLEQAQRFGARFINRADGNTLLKKQLKDFTKS